MRKFIYKILFFSALLVVFLLIKKQVTPFYLGDQIFKAKYYDYLKQQENFNTVVFGSSRLYRHVKPWLLDSLLNKYNFSTYNFAVGATYNPEVYYLFENFLQSIDSAQIKTAFLELQVLHSYSKENCQTTKASYWNTLNFFLFAYHYIMNAEYSEDKKENLLDCYVKSYMYSFFDFSLFINLFSNNNIKEIGEHGFYALEDAMQDNGKNNIFKKRWNEFRSDTMEIEKRIHSAKITPESIPQSMVNETHLRYLQQLINKSKSKGIHLVFVVSPRMHANQYKELLPLTESLPPVHSIKLYKYPEFKAFYRAENSFDVGHLNSKGARIFTRYFAHEIRKILRLKYKESTAK